MAAVDDILTFWLDEVGSKGWYAVDDALDAKIREKFYQTWKDALDGAYGLWLTYPSGTLAYLILMDQIPRNMFRGFGDAFASDGLALAAAKIAIDRGWDQRIDEPARQFFYLPLMHSENLSDQERCVRLMLSRMPEGGEENLRHARAHREVIRQFGRFPYRNTALERETTPLEIAFLQAGGYGMTLEQLDKAS